MVPTLSIFFMVLSLVISLCLTIGLFLFFRKKWDLKFIPALIGAAAFIIAVMILEQQLHMLVLRPNADGSIDLAVNNPLLYVLYGIMAAGIFEETARFICFHLMKRKYQGVGTALSYGIGHGGVEALLLLGLTMVNNLIISAIINAGNADMMGDTPQVLEAVRVMKETEPFVFAVGGLERIFAVAIQISLSVLVWYAVNGKGRLWLYPAAIGLHAAVDVAPAMMQCGIIKDMVLVEAITAAWAVALVFIAVKAHKRLKEDKINAD